MKLRDVFILALATTAFCMALAATYSVTLELSQRDQYHLCLEEFPGAVTDSEVEAIDSYCRDITGYKGK